MSLIALTKPQFVLDGEFDDVGSVEQLIVVSERQC